jgi:hypothetical protein
MLRDASRVSQNESRQKIRVQFSVEKYRHNIVQELGVTTARTSFSFVPLSAIQFV